MEESEDEGKVHVVSDTVILKIKCLGKDVDFASV
jgi:hypothetical protein